MRALSNQSSSRTPARSLTFTAVASLIAVVPQLELQMLLRMKIVEVFES